MFYGLPIHFAAVGRAWKCTFDIWLTPIIMQLQLHLDRDTKMQYYVYNTTNITQ